MSATIQRYRKGQHLKQTQRLLIEHLRLQGHSTRDIADVVGCSHVTVCNELKRGQYEHTNSDLTTEIRYSPEIAEQRYQTNLHRSRLDTITSSLRLWKLWSSKRITRPRRQWPN